MGRVRTSRLTPAERAKAWRERHPEKSSAVSRRSVERMKERNMRHIIDHWFTEKNNRECVTCGHTGPYCHFDWDHKQAFTKENKEKDNISYLFSRASIADIDAAMERCQLLCKLCHAEKTAREMNHRYAFH